VIYAAAAALMTQETDIPPAPKPGDELLRPLTVRIRNFRCFKDSGPLRLDERTTVLIAENENGKTSALEALAWFDSLGPLDEEDIWDGNTQPQPLPIVSVEFAVSVAAKQSLSEQGVRTPDVVVITKLSNGELGVSDREGEPLDDSEMRSRRFEEARSRLGEVFAGLASAGHPVADAQALLAELTEEAGHPELNAAVQSLVASLSAPANQEVEQAFGAIAGALLDRGATVIFQLRTYLPRFVLFDQYLGDIPDDIRFDEFEAAPEDSKHQRFDLIAKLARLNRSLAEIAGLDPRERARIDEQTSDELSTQYNEYWEEDPIRVKFRFEVETASLSISHKGRDQRPSRKSRGLRWFLDFYGQFVGHTRGELKNAVLLIDEPGLYIHIKRQQALLKLFEKIAAENQIVYTTHLPQLIPAYSLPRLRILETDPKTGTVSIINDIRKLQGKEDALAPVRQALGLDIASPIALGATTLIVEGETDAVLLHQMSEVCRREGKTHLDEEVTIFHAGGASKITAPAGWLAAGFVRGVVLLDDDAEGRKALDKIRRAYGGRVAIVRTHETIAKEGAELEDLLDRDYFVHAINESHRDVSGFREIAAPAAAADNVPICDYIGTQLKNLGGSKTKEPKLRKTQAARTIERWILDGDQAKAVSDVTLDRFSRLFERVNNALKQEEQASEDDAEE
jgi:AAA domain, putative AbiEii toxin, Type IV TA system/AAA ATPase domain